MTDVPPRRRCVAALNSFHSLVYFTPELDGELARLGVTDPMAVYLAGRAAPLGEVGPGVVVALFNAFAHEGVARHLPSVWRTVSPTDVVAARWRAADALLRRLLGEDVAESPDVAEAARVAWAAIRDCPRAARPMFAANADLGVPERPHLLLWHAATLAREYRGDGHVTVLGDAELTGLAALVTDCVSPTGMPRQLVMGHRGWTGADWSAEERRLRERGLLDSRGALTEAGAALRRDIEARTDRLDRLPYETIGEQATDRLADLVGGLVKRAAGAFPDVLRDFFVPA